VSTTVAIAQPYPRASACEHAAMIEYPPGTPSWVDLSSPDLDASARFYGELLGWEAAASEGAPEETGGYRMFTLDGADVAGLGPSQPGQPPAWTTYVAVADASSARAKVEAAGGSTVMEPLEVMDAGTMAVFSDAEGAFFAVWQADRHRGAQIVNAPAALTMNELRTRDLDGAARFYGEVFGWEIEPLEQGGEVVYGSVRLGGRLVAGALPMGDNFPPQLPPHWIPYFGVESLEAAAAKATELGGQALTEPITVPQGRFLALVDPQGAAFMVLEGQYDPPPGS
jgi:predicted enzyme related to lactoylglutathione lyase